MNYYKDLNRKINAKLKAEKAKRDKEEKLEVKHQKREQAAALKRMKRQGILEKERKAYAETRERRLKKLGMKVEKEKKGDSWIFHVDKTGYKGKGGLFKKKKPVTIKWGIKKSIPKKRSRKKKGGFWDKMRTL